MIRKCPQISASARQVWAERLLFAVGSSNWRYSKSWDHPQQSWEYHRPENRKKDGVECCDTVFQACHAIRLLNSQHLRPLSQTHMKLGTPTFCHGVERGSQGLWRLIGSLMVARVFRYWYCHLVKVSMLLHINSYLCFWEILTASSHKNKTKNPHTGKTSWEKDQSRTTGGNEINTSNTHTHT